MRTINDAAGQARLPTSPYPESKSFRYTTFQYYRTIIRTQRVIPAIGFLNTAATFYALISYQAILSPCIRNYSMETLNSNSDYTKRSTRTIEAGVVGQSQARSERMSSEKVAITFESQVGITIVEPPHERGLPSASSRRVRTRLPSAHILSTRPSVQ